jgi:hypothetical protein
MYDENFALAEDHDLWIRFSEVCKIDHTTLAHSLLTKQERKTTFGNAEPNVILSDFDADAINEGLKIILKKRYANRWQFINDHWKEILPIGLQFFFNTNVHPGLIYGD